MPNPDDKLHPDIVRFMEQQRKVFDRAFENVPRAEPIDPLRVEIDALKARRAELEAAMIEPSE